MSHERSITVIAMRRPLLFRRMLQSLVANDLAGWRIVIRVDPTEHSDDFRAIAEVLLTGVEYDLKVNPHVTGINLNPFLAVESAFAAGSKLNLYLEEDFVVAPDATALALWYEREHKPGWLCLSLLAGPCGSAGFLSNERYPDLLFAGPTFNSIGFVMRREEWHAHARTAWLGDQRSASREFHADWRHNWCWDWSVYGLSAANPTLRVIQPVLARATHTGRVGGVYASPEFHDRAFVGLPINARRHIDYRLTEVDQLPHEVRAHVTLHEELTAMRMEMEQVALRAAPPGLLRSIQVSTRAAIQEVKARAGRP
jgi:hypothetical protein